MKGVEGGERDERAKKKRVEGRVGRGGKRV